MKRLRSLSYCTLVAALFVSTANAQPPGGGERPEGGRPEGGRPEGGRPEGGRPEGGRPGGPGRPDVDSSRGPEMMMRMIPVLVALDADKDGTISKSEIENASTALLTLDKNGDGELSTEEMRPDFAGMRGGPFGRGSPEGERPEGERGPGGFGSGDPAAFMARMFTERDANNDGKLSKDELPEQMAERMDRIDTDGDGSVSREELETSMARMRERGRPDGGRPEGGRPDGEGRGEGGGQPGGDRPKRPEAE
jgi:Ca2+-binding EF-hand superfamily protein